MNKLLILLILTSACTASELAVMRNAADRNNCRGDNFKLLRAIRRAENGRKGIELGILAPKALALIAKHPERSLDIQAGWASATIMNQHKRSGIKAVNDKFIESLGRRYCPVNCDNDNGTNKFWTKNVKFFFYKFKGGQQ